MAEATDTSASTSNKRKRTKPPAPTTLRQMLEQEIARCHSLEHRKPAQAYVLFGDGTLGTTKGGLNFGYRNMKPYLAAMRNEECCTLPLRDEERKCTYAIVDHEEGKRLRLLMKQLCGLGDAEDCTYEEACEEMTVEELHNAKKKKAIPDM